MNLPFLSNQNSSDQYRTDLLNKAVRIVLQNLHNEQFSVATFADEMCMSRMNLHRWLKELANASTTAFIRRIRLHKAAEMLKNRNGTVIDICFGVGFQHPSYFIRCFRKEFGQTPFHYSRNFLKK